MMNNLFSMFDPSTSTMKMNWMALLIPILIIPLAPLMSNKKNLTMKIIMKTLAKEIEQMIHPHNKMGGMILMLSLFATILFINFNALMPFIFAPTAQISITLSISIIMWLSFILLGWMKNTKKMMAHLVPLGTPPMLMPLMVLIELTSNLIRPITLSIRLMANMVAGHLLMTLLGNLSISNMSMLLSTAPLTMVLTALEVSVSAIQAYVITALLALYSSEAN